MHDVTKLLELQRKKQDILQRIKDLEMDFAITSDTLKEQCTHPTTETTEKHCRGGYDYVSSIVITKTCTICRKVLESYDDLTHKGTHE